MLKEDYLSLKESIIQNGFAEEINYFDELLRDSYYTPYKFLAEYVWVVVNSGMNYHVAEKIYRKIINAVKNNEDIYDVFKHTGKVNAIKYVCDNLETIYNQFIFVEDKISFLESLPWIGKTTKYHLARNIGIDTCKPDRHLIRIANKYNLTPFSLCENISNEVGDKVGVVDYVIWRAAIMGLI